MRVITWLLRAVLFFVLFAFALNNQHEVRLKWFFGYEWRAPMVIVVLVTFAAGCALGLLGHLPGWWRRWRAAKAGLSASGGAAASVAGTAKASPASDVGVPSAYAPGPDTLIEPPRDGL